MTCVHILCSRVLLPLSSPVSPPLSTPSPKMSTALPPPQARGIDYNLPTCGEIECNGRGTCVVPPGGGADLVCECQLGYRGQTCEDTVHGELSLPLTLGVVAVLVGMLVMAFIFAKLRQKQKQRRRY